MKLGNQIVIVTGAASGIGRASALLFAREGAKVVIADKNVVGGTEVMNMIRKKGHDALFVRTDVSKAAQVRKLVKRTLTDFKTINVLFNNAGIEVEGTLIETSEREFDQVVATNLKGVFLCSKYVIPHMIKNHGGVIINTSSELAFVGAKRLSAYCATKAAIVNITRAMAADFARYNIRVNCLCPGPVNTPMLEKYFTSTSSTRVSRRNQLRSVPLARFGRPEEIASAALFLASDQSSFVTGASLVVDGGATATYGL